MKNVMTIDGYSAVIQYDSEIDMFRGEFIGINGGADFYACDTESLKKEAATSLKVFLEACKEDGVEPQKNYSGKFVLRVDPDQHQLMELAAKADGVSLNKWAVEALKNAAH